MVINNRKGRELTPKQSILVQKITEMSIAGKPKSKYSLLKESGYSENTALQPNRILNSKLMKKEIKSLLERLEEKRDLAIDAITKDKTIKQSAKDNAHTADILEKNVRLIRGESTDNTNVSLLNLIPDED